MSRIRNLDAFHQRPRYDDLTADGMCGGDLDFIYSYPTKEGNALLIGEFKSSHNTEMPYAQRLLIGQLCCAWEIAGTISPAFAGGARAAVAKHNRPADEDYTAASTQLVEIFDRQGYWRQPKEPKTFREMFAECTKRQLKRRRKHA